MKNKLRPLQPGKLIFIGLLSFVLASASVSWAQIVVTTLANSGPGSLSEAITTANTDGVATTITFDPAIFPPSPGAPGIILLSTALPTLNGLADTIDGTGAGVVIDGTGLAANTVGLRIRRSNITIRGLTIQNFPGDGIRVETPPPPTTVTTVTGVVIESNNLFANGNRGIRVTGGQGPTTSGGTGGGKTVAASITNNTITDSVNGGILVIGNLNSSLDFGGHHVTALIDNNTIKRSQEQIETGTAGGNGIDIVGGTGVGSNSVVTATVSNNTVHRNFDHGISVTGCSNGSAGLNNAVHVTIINNAVKENGFNGDPTTTRDGIDITGASGATADATSCAGNSIQFNVSNNDTGGNRNRNIIVAGGSGSEHDLQGIISGNTAKDSAEDNGISVSGGRGAANHVHDVTVSENQVSGNFNQGISVSGGTESINATVNNIAVISNHVFNNGNHGIIASGGTDTLNAAITGVSIDGNLSTGNGTRGIQASSGNTTGAINSTVRLIGITNNTASSNADDGIFIGNGVPGTGSTPVSGNRADRNGVDGIDISSTGYVLSSNTASRNAADGINGVANTNGGGNTGKGNGSCNQPFTGCLP